MRSAGRWHARNRVPADDGPGAVRLTIRVKPGAGRARVHRDGDVLVVAVTAPPVDGRATRAALEAVAAALGVRPRAVTLVTGATSRTKLVEVGGDEPALLQRLAALPSSGPDPAAPAADQ